MRHIESAGIIVYYQNEFLLLHYAHGHWDLPKGKLEAGETKQQAALRELQEETGLQADIISEFSTSFSYIYTEVDGILTKKTVYFFLGEAKSKKVVLSHEHIGYAWLPYQDAHKQLTFDNAKEALAKAYQFLQAP